MLIIKSTYFHRKKKKKAGAVTDEVASETDAANSLAQSISSGGAMGFGSAEMMVLKYKYAVCFDLKSFM